MTVNTGVEAEGLALEILQAVSDLKLTNRQHSESLIAKLEVCNSIDLRLEAFSNRLMDLMKAGNVDLQEMETLKQLVNEVVP